MSSIDENSETNRISRSSVIQHYMSKEVSKYDTVKRQFSLVSGWESNAVLSYAISSATCENTTDEMFRQVVTPQLGKNYTFYWFDDTHKLIMVTSIAKSGRSEGKPKFRGLYRIHGPMVDPCTIPDPFPEIDNRYPVVIRPDGAYYVRGADVHRVYEFELQALI